MNLSNKSTFSLACLILLMAFVAIPVMAHETTDETHDRILPSKVMRRTQY